MFSIIGARKFTGAINNCRAFKFKRPTRLYIVIVNVEIKLHGAIKLTGTRNIINCWALKFTQSKG